MFIRQRTQSARLLRCSRMAVALALPSALHCQLTSSRCGAACRARDMALASERRARRSPPRMALAAPPRNFCSELEISLAFLLPRPEICAGPRAPRPAFPGHAGGKTAKALRGAVGHAAAGDFFGPSPRSQCPWAAPRFSRPAGPWPPAAPEHAVVVSSTNGEEWTPFLVQKDGNLQKSWKKRQKF